MTAKRQNKILRIEDGVAWIDVSTNMHPLAVTQVREFDLPLVFDGGCGWRCTTRATSGPYVVRWNGEREQLLHRRIVDPAHGKILCDHKNHDGLDNRRENLRKATHSQNGANARSHRDAVASQFLGVDRHADGKWRARSVEAHIGLFDTEEAAARAYDAVALRLFGEFANLNFPPPERAA